MRCPALPLLHFLRRSRPFPIPKRSARTYPVWTALQRSINSRSAGQHETRPALCAGASVPVMNRQSLCLAGDRVIRFPQKLRF
jgi:hypothetical protein